MQDMCIKDRDIAMSSVIQVIKSYDALGNWKGLLILTKIKSAHYNLSLPLIVAKNCEKNTWRNCLRTLKSKVNNSRKMRKRSQNLKNV